MHRGHAGRSPRAYATVSPSLVTPPGQAPRFRVPAILQIDVSTDDDRGRLEVAIHAAREGGRLALQHVGDPLYFKIKGHRDVMVGAAQVVQDAIRDVLLAAYPDDAFMGEEGPD